MKKADVLTRVEGQGDLIPRLEALSESSRADMTQFLDRELNRAQEMTRMMDSKTSTILLIAGGISGSIIFKMLSDNSAKSLSSGFFVATLVLLAGSGVCGGMVILPRIMRGWKTILFHVRPNPKRHLPLSPHFFGDICLHATTDDYLADVLETTTDSVRRLRALADQVRINAEITYQKSLWVSRSALCLKLGIVLGLIAGVLKYLL